MLIQLSSEIAMPYSTTSGISDLFLLDILAIDILEIWIKQSIF